MRRLALALTALVAPAVASAATTQPYVAGDFLHRAALAGDRVVVAEQRPGRVIRLLSVPVTGGTPVTLLEAAPGPGGSAFVTYAGSPSRVIARRSLGGAPTDVLAGPPAGPLTALDGCSPAPEVLAPPAADGDLAAWAGADCSDSRIRIQDGDNARVIDAGGFVHAVAVARPYVAWLAVDRDSSPLDTRLVVHDATTGQDAYNVVVPPASTLDVQADGTAVVATFAPVDRSCGGGPSAHIRWYSPGQTQGTEVPVRTCEAAVRIAGGRIAFVQALTGGGRMLSLTGLQGGTPQPVARLDAFPPQAAFDFDGTRVAWSLTRCRDDVVRVRDATDTSAPDPPVRCPVRVGTPRLSRDRTIHVPIACPNGCRARARQGMTVIAPRWLHVWSKTRLTTRYAPYVRFDLAPGRRTTLKLPTTRHQRRVIRRKGRVAVRLKVVAQDIYLPRIARTLRVR